MEERNNGVTQISDYIERKNKLRESNSYDSINVHNELDNVMKFKELFGEFINSPGVVELLNGHPKTDKDDMKPELSIDQEDTDDNKIIGNNYYQKYMEVELKMKKIQNLNKEHVEFIIVSFSTIIFSLIGLLVFSISGYYFIHPSIYMLGLLMGIGWAATAIVSIYKHRKDNK